MLRSNHPLIFTFYTKNDFNSRNIKKCLFFLYFSLDMTINALFFNDDTMHQIYVDEGKYNFLYQIPQIIYSYIISMVFSNIISFFSLTEDQIIEIKQNQKFIFKELLSKLKIKFIIFFILDFLLLLFFWYYLSCFCAVYRNTQIHLVKDSLVSQGLSLLFPIVTCIIPSILRIISLKAVNKNKGYLYKFSQFLQLL